MCNAIGIFYFESVTIVNFMEKLCPYILLRKERYQYKKASFVALLKRTLGKVILQQSAIYASQSITQSPLFHIMNSVATASQHGYNLSRKIMQVHVYFSLYFRS